MNGSMHSDDGAPLLEVRELKKHFPVRQGWFGPQRDPVRAVDGVNFRIEQGRTLGLVGESGCGKTTVARCILRILDPTAGTIHYRDADGHVVDLASQSPRQIRPYRRDVQMIFQNPFTSLNPRMTLLDIVGEPLLIHDRSTRRERIDRVAELLELVGLRAAYMRRFPHAFSGGQRQRIGIARALALHPRLIVADEPVSALDVSIQAQVLNLMTELQQRMGLTYLFVSHDLSVVRHVCDHVAVMYLGRIVEFADTETLFRSPKHPYTAALLSAVPEADPRARSDLTVLEGEVPNPASPPPGCTFHPRCPHADDSCRTQIQSAHWPSPDQMVACHRADDLDLEGID